jgi:hypothetical protein
MDPTGITLRLAQWKPCVKESAARRANPPNMISISADIVAAISKTRRIWALDRGRALLTPGGLPNRSIRVVRSALELAAAGKLIAYSLGSQT